MCRLRAGPLPPRRPARPHAAFHTQRRGCCTARPMLCAGWRSEAPAAALRAPFRVCARCGDGRNRSPNVPGREAFHVATDEPMMASMAGRYAAALFELAKEERQLLQVEADLQAFQAMLDDSADLRRLVRSPVISADDQAKALAALFWPRSAFLGAHRQLLQADRAQSAPVRRRRHDQRLSRPAGARARRGQRRRGHRRIRSAPSSCKR